MAVGGRGEGRARSFQTLHTLGIVGDLTDGQLLERFAAGSGEVSELAFAVLVERHGAMVRRACLAVLRNEHEAEDASQAVFLVLARKAGTLRARGSLGPWLHRVAWRTAAGLRATAARCRRHELRLAGRDTDPVVEPAGSTDLDRDAAIHEELARLPEAYRAAVVLCDLEGRTHSETARILGCPVGTVKSRQARGRRMIRDRLARRGVGLAVAAAAVDSMGRAAAATLPASIGLATGIGASPHVLSLAQGVLRTMFWIKIRSLAAAVVLVGLTVGGIGSYVRGGQEGPPGDRPSQEATRPEPPQREKPLPSSDLKFARFAVREQEARCEIARQNRLLAEIALEAHGARVEAALEEYGIARHDLDKAAIENEIKVAASDLARALDRVKQTGKMLEKGDGSPSPKGSEDLNLQKARSAWRKAYLKHQFLVEFMVKKTESLRSDLLMARQRERFPRMELENARRSVAELERRVHQSE